jgi:hypothetical protein
VEIYSTLSDSDNAYGVYDGTSMAAPHVSGVAALIRARFPNIGISGLRSRLLDSVVPTNSLAGITSSGGLTLPAGIEAGHGAHLYFVRVTGVSRDAVVKTLKEKNQVGTAYHYPIVGTWEAFNDLEFDKSDCDIAVEASSQVISLPVFAQSTDEELEYVAWAIERAIAESK